jgi:hypothetical protein
MTRTLLALCAFALAGCGGATKVSTPPADPRAEYQSSLDAYQACVIQASIMSTPARTSACKWKPASARTGPADRQVADSLPLIVKLAGPLMARPRVAALSRFGL